MKTLSISLFLLCITIHVVCGQEAFSFRVVRSNFHRDRNLLELYCETANAVVRNPVFFRGTETIDIPTDLPLGNGAILFNINRTFEGVYRCGRTNNFEGMTTSNPKTLVGEFQCSNNSRMLVCRNGVTNGCFGQKWQCLIALHSTNSCMMVINLK